VAEWMPIDSAPRDGGDFLAYSASRKECGVAYFIVTFTEFPSLICNNSYGESFNPTHWMPLPEPPEVKP
jgi:hypothetical protein